MAVGRPLAEDTDDRARLIAHAYLATDYPGIAAEAFLPELVRQHDDTVAAWHTFIWTERTAECERMALAETLADCVAGGASLGFRSPFSIEDAHRWWGSVIESVAAGNTLLFGAFVSGRLYGTVQLGFDGPCNQRHRGDVRKLLVHREARGRGLGNQLMTALENEAAKRKLALLTLDTASGSNAERLYEKRGYQNDEWVDDSGYYLTTRRGLFLKASYLYRF